MNQNLIDYFAKKVTRKVFKPRSSASGYWKKAYFFNEYAVLKWKKRALHSNLLHSTRTQTQFEEMKNLLALCKQEGAQVPQMFAQKYFFSLRKQVKNYVEIYEKVPGKSLIEAWDWAWRNPTGLIKRLNDLPQEHCNQLLRSVFILNKHGLFIDFNPKNFLYNKQTGFWAIDFNIDKQHKPLSLPELAKEITHCFESRVKLFYGVTRSKQNDPPVKLTLKRMVKKPLVVMAKTFRRTVAGKYEDSLLEPFRTKIAAAAQNVLQETLAR